MNSPPRALTLIACAAGPASALGTIAGLAVERQWDVQVVATPSALAFFDRAQIERQTGKQVKSEYSTPGAARSRIPAAMIVAPATYNTINKWALGISDTYALGVLAELTGMGIPVVVLPFVDSALASRSPYQRSVASLRAEGVQILYGPDSISPHPPRTGSDLAHVPLAPGAGRGRKSDHTQHVGLSEQARHPAGRMHSFDAPLLANTDPSLADLPEPPTPRPARHGQLACLTVATGLLGLARKAVRCTACRSRCPNPDAGTGHDRAWQRLHDVARRKVGGRSPRQGWPHLLLPLSLGAVPG